MKRIMLFLAALLAAPDIWAMHPLITDDAGTQGSRGVQIEINSQFDHDEAAGTTEDCSELATVLSYGVSEDIDIVAGVPLSIVRTQDANGISDAGGFSDATLEIKWRFYRAEAVELALKPGVTFPTGDKTAGLTSERFTQSLFLIASKSLGKAGLHANAGYIRNNNVAGERADLWHASFAGDIGAMKALRAVANIGIERAPDAAGGSNPAFIMAGMVYSPHEKLDLDIGFKKALTESETDHTILVGTAVRF